ncbi:MAG: hypothetical protein K2K81_05805 [Muribaculaceae bacterium]|nr:hypothetical protein [Muribaculaceae bacterium]
MKTTGLTFILCALIFWIGNINNVIALLLAISGLLLILSEMKGSKK